MGDVGVVAADQPAGMARRVRRQRRDGDLEPGRRAVALLCQESRRGAQRGQPQVQQVVAQRHPVRADQGPQLGEVDALDPYGVVGQYGAVGRRDQLGAARLGRLGEQFRGAQAGGRGVVVDPALDGRRAVRRGPRHLVGRSAKPQPQVRAVQPVALHVHGQAARRAAVGERQERLAQQRALDRLVVVGDHVAGGGVPRIGCGLGHGCLLVGPVGRDPGGADGRPAR